MATVSEVAEFLGMDRDQVKRWAKEFAEYLSLTAQPAKGKERQFSEAERIACFGRSLDDTHDLHRKLESVIRCGLRGDAGKAVDGNRTRAGTVTIRRAPCHHSHVHSREEEGFYVLEGEITLFIGDQLLAASAGMFANMPVGTPHSFKNESGKPAKLLISVAPAGLEQMFFEVGVPVPPGATTATSPTNDEIERLLSAAPRYGIEIKLPPP